jgi:hypothetical protein
MRKFGVLVALPLVGALLGVSPAAAQPTPEATAFCDAALGADRALAKLETGGRPKRSDVQALETALSRAESSAPPEIATQVQAVVAATRRAIQERKDPFEVDPNFGPNFNALQEYRYNSCGYAQLDVTGIEYEFQGLPKTLTAGPVAVRFTDTGAELHELIVFRLKTKDSVRRFLGLPEKEQERKADFIGATEAEQNQTTYEILDMSKPGRYAVACFLPRGSTSPEAVEEAEHEHGGGRPHWRDGMRAEIRVQAA